MYDGRTNLYWSVDCFGANVPHPAQSAADLRPEDWRDGFLLLNRINNPWYQWLDRDKFLSQVERIGALGAEVLASCHGPALHGPLVAEALQLIRRVPELPPWIEPGPEFIEEMLARATVAVPIQGSPTG